MFRVTSSAKSIQVFCFFFIIFFSNNIKLVQVILLHKRNDFPVCFFFSSPQHYLDSISLTISLSFRPEVVIVSSVFGRACVVSVGNNIMSGFQG